MTSIPDPEAEAGDPAELSSAERHQPAAPGAGAAADSAVERRTVPLFAEELQVERREREGRVRVRKVVHEDLASVDEELREESVRVERVPVQRLADGIPGIREEGDVLVVPVLEERLVVEKRLFIVEELRISRHSTTRRAPQQVKLRREEVIVERLDPETQEWRAVEIPLQAAASRRDGPDRSLSGASAPTAPKPGRADEA